MARWACSPRFASVRERDRPACGAALTFGAAFAERPPSAASTALIASGADKAPPTPAAGRPCGPRRTRGADARGGGPGRCPRPPARVRRPPPQRVARVEELLEHRVHAVLRLIAVHADLLDDDPLLGLDIGGAHDR